MSPEKKAWIKPFFQDKVSSIPKPTVNKQPKPIKNVKRQHSQSNCVKSSWCDKYAPQNVSNLAVHSGKIKEIKQWFGSLKNCRSNKFLLVTGPSGCAKATTIRLVGKECGFMCVEWVTPITIDSIYDQCSENFYYESVQDKFQDFIWGATRYKSLNCNSSNGQFLLIKDLPNIFLDKPDEFQDIMTRFNTVSSFPIVFIINNEKIIRDLFPNEIFEKLQVKQIKFNLVTRKSVLSVLEQIVKAEKQKNSLIRLPSTSEMNNLYDETNGDLRSSIINLSFLCMNIQNKITKTSLKSKDENLDLFHSVGRVIYPKKEIVKSPLQFKFTYNPDYIAENFAMQPNTVLGFLQENYLSRFSNLNDVCEGADAISVADVIMNSSFKFGVSIYEISLSSLSVAVRGLMLANKNPIKTFRAIIKPKHFQYNNDVQIYRDVREWYHDSHESPKDILLDIMPFVKALGTNQQKDIALERWNFKKHF
ncbi:cell cycle checkpoint protein RAD17 [Daktulosphaira vitifoliae]|uniref:cell cycle checkpoint protein RAD17 n=1 Tax=Daktulosphaira vitifoliae TaxID=58002 RepID=UPI0021AADC27|nr:cell cycle checkpoint protein RAD17 [Daktulosphaira vitifoliae]XP_050532368.1 cell cycle checkpoint protein RAD17 [Daktulosphaira vitifoliae]